MLKGFFKLPSKITQIAPIALREMARNPLNVTFFFKKYSKKSAIKGVRVKTTASDREEAVFSASNINTK